MVVVVVVLCGDIVSGDVIGGGAGEGDRGVGGDGKVDNDGGDGNGGNGGNGGGGGGDISGSEGEGSRTALLFYTKGHTPNLTSIHPIDLLVNQRRLVRVATVLWCCASVNNECLPPPHVQVTVK